MNIDPAKATGALVGGDIGQLIVASLHQFAHIDCSQAVEASIISLCIFLASHFLVPTQPAMPAIGASK